MCKKRFLLCVLIWLSIDFAGWAANPPADLPGQSPPMRLFVGILPQAYIVERIGGESVTVDVLVGPGQSPATFDPTPKDMSRLYETEAFFRIGLPFESRLIEKTSMIDGFNVVDMREGITLRTIANHHHGDSIHKGESDPHIWLNPQLVKIQARHVFQELARLKPAQTAYFEANLLALESDLDRADSTVAAILTPYANTAFFVFHPSYGYFADRYGLRQVAVEAGGKEPGARHMALLINEAREEGIKAIFIQPQFSTRTAEAVAREVGCQVVELDPLAHDYIENLLRMANRIAEALESRAEGK